MYDTNFKDTLSVNTHVLKLHCITLFSQKILYKSLQDDFKTYLLKSLAHTTNIHVLIIQLLCALQEAHIFSRN